MILPSNQLLHSFYAFLNLSPYCYWPSYHFSIIGAHNSTHIDIARILTRHHSYHTHTRHHRYTRHHGQGGAFIGANWRVHRKRAFLLRGHLWHCCIQIQSEKEGSIDRNSQNSEGASNRSCARDASAKLLAFAGSRGINLLSSGSRGITAKW